MCKTLGSSFKELLEATNVASACSTSLSVNESSDASTALSRDTQERVSSAEVATKSNIIVSTTLELHQLLSALSGNHDASDLIDTRVSIGLAILFGFVLLFQPSPSQDCPLLTIHFLPPSSFSPVPLKRPLAHLIILIGGTSGSGKSTVASEVRTLLSVNEEPQLLASDEIRDEMRHSYPKSHLIWRSTYNVADVLYDGSAESKKRVLEGFEAQASLVKARVAKSINPPLRRSIVIEGVHITASFVAQINVEHPSIVIPFFLRVPDPVEHRHRFEKRGPKTAPSITPVSNASEKYFHYFDNIRCISDYITQDAEQCGYDVVDNDDLESVLCTVLRRIVDLQVQLCYL